MKNPLVYAVLIAFGAIITYILAGDLFGNRLKKSVKNPYAYDLGGIRNIDPELVKYRETRRIATSLPEPVAIAYRSGLLGIGYHRHIQVIDTLGRERFNISVAGPVTAIAFSPEGNIVAGMRTFVQEYSPAGSLLESWPVIDTSAYITSIAVREEDVYVANAGDPSVAVYTRDGEIVHAFDGRNRPDRHHGFIVPSPYFDLAFDRTGRLWVANTGMQAIENYHYDGSLASAWGNPSHELSGFIGCCNPAHFTILSDGSFVTAEKGLVRIKVFSPSGELERVVAGPDAFHPDADPPDLTSDEQGNVYVLDITGNLVRKFERMQSI
jgi:hypothetical protein